MANFDNIIQEINTNLPDNNTQAITAAKLRTTLIDLTNTIEDQQDSFETTINGEISDLEDNVSNTINERLNETELTSSITDGYYILSDGSIGGTGSSANSYAEINVEGFNKIRFLSVKSKTNTTVGWCFGHYSGANFIVDSARPIQINSNQDTNFKLEYITQLVPENATTARISIYKYSGLITNDSFKCYGSKDNDTHNFNIIDDLSFYITSVNLIYNGSDYIWTSANTSTREGYHIPVKGGKFIKFKTGTVNIVSGNVKSGLVYMVDNPVTNGTNANNNVLKGALPIILESNREYMMQIPDGCSYVDIEKRYSSNNYVEIKEFYVEETLENEPQLDTIELYDTLSYRYSTAGGTISGTYYVYKIPADYTALYANYRIGYLYGDIAFVAYLDSEYGFLGYEQQIASVGYNKLYTNILLENIPQNAVYVAISQSIITSVLKLKDVANNDTYYYKEFSVDVIPFNTIDNNTETTATKRNSGWGFMLPKSYDPNGTPSPVIAMLHGGSGYVSENVFGYPNSGGTATATYWDTWQKKYLDAGFIVFDVNGYGTYTENTESGSGGGCPIAIETVKKAFDYLKTNFNVRDKMFIHGTSMGGSLALGYIRLYPNDVISVGLFAPWTNINGILVEATHKNEIARAWGYTDYDDEVADNYSHLYGYAPFFDCLKIKKADNTIYLNKVNTEMVQDFIKDTDGVTGDSEYIYIEQSKIPMKVWLGTNDTAVPLSMGNAIVNTYRNGQTSVRLRIIEGATHNFCSGNSHPWVANEAIEFFKESLK